MKLRIEIDTELAGDAFEGLADLFEMRQSFLAQGKQAVVRRSDGERVGTMCEVQVMGRATRDAAALVILQGLQAGPMVMELTGEALLHAAFVRADAYIERTEK